MQLISGNNISMAASGVSSGIGSYQLAKINVNGVMAKACIEYDNIGEKHPAWRVNAAALINGWRGGASAKRRMA